MGWFEDLMIGWFGNMEMGWFGNDGITISHKPKAKNKEIREKINGLIWRFDNGLDFRKNLSLRGGEAISSKEEADCHAMSA